MGVAGNKRYSTQMLANPHYFGYLFFIFSLKNRNSQENGGETSTSGTNGTTAKLSFPHLAPSPVRGEESGTRFAITMPRWISFVGTGRPHPAMKRRIRAGNFLFLRENPFTFFGL